VDHHERRLREAVANPEAMVERVGLPDRERATGAAGEALGYALELAGLSEAFASGFLEGTRKARIDVEPEPKVPRRNPGRPEILGTGEEAQLDPALPSRWPTVLEFGVLGKLEEGE
jgi:hypothetical protein